MAGGLDCDAKASAGIRLCERCNSPFSGTARARFCRACWPARVKKRKTKYAVGDAERAIFEELYDGSVGCAKAIKRRLGWPVHAIYRAACELGLSRTKHASADRQWTEEEMDILREWTGRRSSRWIAKRLGRTKLSVVRKQQRAGMGTAVHDGYTLEQVAGCFGVTSKTVHEWINSGKLVASVQNSDRERDVYRISDEALKDFIRRYPLAYKFHRVDQLWFLGFVLGDLGLREEREGMPVELNKGGKVRRGLSRRAECGGVSTSGIGLECA